MMYFWVWSGLEQDLVVLEQQDHVIAEQQDLVVPEQQDLVVLEQQDLVVPVQGIRYKVIPYPPEPKLNQN